MNELTYYARFGYCDDGICVSFPDVDMYTYGFSKEEAIEMAKEALILCLDVKDDYKVVFYPPSTLEELEKEANGELEEYENSFEFVPITITPDNDSYLKKLVKHRRYVI